LAVGLTTASTALAAPAGGKPPDNPFDERTGGGETAGQDESDAAAKKTAAREDAQASDDEEPAEEARGEEEDAEGGLHALACLEGDSADGKRKGVQRRDFLKKHRFELGAVGGWYASDALSSTYSYGGALAFYPSEDFGLEVLVTRTPIAFRLEEPFNQFGSERHFIPSVAYQGIASLLWSPIHAKFKFTDATIIHGDIFALAGAGRTFHESVLGLTWEAGLGLKLYFSRFVTFRLEVRDFLIPQEVLGRGRSTNNITILAGFSLWLL
jgi:outer membrane beta-barrel protein